MTGLIYVTSAVTAVIVVYYLALFLVSLWTTRRHARPATACTPFFVIVVPAHNEAVVIAETVRRLRELRGERLLAIVMNDGSTDDTSRLARVASDGDPRCCVIDRSRDEAGQGKGAVLNHAYTVVASMVASGDPRLGGATAEEVVVGIVDADGWLDPDALEAVAPFYGDSRVAGVQVPVRIWNSRQSFLTLMQDLEFVGFSLFVQAGRDPFGSVGLGGNGQFVRLSALQSLGARPWSSCLTEDLDLGLRMVEHGWRNRFCPGTSVSQQAVDAFRPFFRQRTRWIQGHYSCWHRLPALWRSDRVPLPTKIDLSLYLLLVAFILVFGVQMIVSFASLAGVLHLNGDFLAWISNDYLARATALTLSIGPLLAFGVTYQRFARIPLPGWALPGVMMLFALYGYVWAVPASLLALGRAARGRKSWVKTPRGSLLEVVPPARP